MKPGDVTEQFYMEHNIEFIQHFEFVRSLSFVFAGPVVPYTRMTQGTRWTKRAQNYLGYRNALADAVRKVFPDWQLPERNKDDKKTDKAWLKEQKARLFALGCNVFFPADNADWSNGLKVIEDALQCAGVLWNDKRIIQSLGGIRAVDKHNPRIEFELRELK